MSKQEILESISEALDHLYKSGRKGSRNGAWNEAETAAEYAVKAGIPNALEILRNSKDNYPNLKALEAKLTELKKQITN